MRRGTGFAPAPPGPGLWGGSARLLGAGGRGVCGGWGKGSFISRLLASSVRSLSGRRRRWSFSPADKEPRDLPARHEGVATSVSTRDRRIVNAMNRVTAIRTAHDRGGGARSCSPPPDATRRLEPRHARSILNRQRWPLRRRARHGRTARHASAVDSETPRQVADSSRAGRRGQRSSSSLALSGSCTANCSRASCKARISCGDPLVTRVVEIQVRASACAAVLLASLTAGVFDQDTAHRLGGGGKEVPSAILQPLIVPGANEPKVRLVNQGSGLERLARPFLGQPMRG